jgi:hypothetical protein
MMMGAGGFFLLNLALAFYNAGTIWAHEVDIFRTWKLIGPQEFHQVQRTHWRKLPYWIFTPVGLGLAGGIGLIRVHPAGSPLWGIWGGVACQLLSLILTALFWGRWQAKLAGDPKGPQSPWLDRILRTHWLRTLLINANALILLAWALALYA